ncbi:hypothetical protein C8F01DRAFT_1366552 [Mycena amicta]|nr:hypothetical protein C8F01DRAFT_1366552 [Mycena amicta]
MLGTEPLLPPELEHELFEYTADLYPDSIPSLLCVANRVLVWLEPTIYHTIRVNYSKRFLAFLAATKLKPTEFFATHVRTIIIYSSYANRSSFPEACAALALCTNVTRIGGAGDIVCSLLLPVLASMRLQRVGFFLIPIFFPHRYPDLSLSCFQTLTHLDVFDSGSLQYQDSEYAMKICALPVLTHLSLNDTVPWEVVNILLQGCRCLQVLVVQWTQSDKGRQRAAEAPLDDTRFLMTSYVRMDESLLDPSNLWSKAQAFIARKRQGMIDSRCFWMDRD